MGKSPGEMTNHQLHDAIEDEPRERQRWRALIREAISRGNAYPRSWLPAGTVFSEYTDRGHHGNQG
jgi:hypothetical protein